MGRSRKLLWSEVLFNEGDNNSKTHLVWVSFKSSVVLFVFETGPYYPRLALNPFVAEVGLEPSCQAIPSPWIIFWITKMFSLAPFYFINPSLGQRACCMCGAIHWGATAPFSLSAACVTPLLSCVQYEALPGPCVKRHISKVFYIKRGHSFLLNKKLNECVWCAGAILGMLGQPA